MDKKPDFKKITEQLTKEFSKATEPIKQMAEEVRKINTPINKKNENIYGSDVHISLLDDGRVIYNFDVISHAEFHYKNIPKLSKESVDALQNQWKRKSLWQRIFKK